MILPQIIKGMYWKMCIIFDHMDCKVVAFKLKIKNKKFTLPNKVSRIFPSFALSYIYKKSNKSQ